MCDIDRSKLQLILKGNPKWQPRTPQAIFQSIRPVRENRRAIRKRSAKSANAQTGRVESADADVASSSKPNHLRSRATHLQKIICQQEPEVLFEYFNTFFIPKANQLPSYCRSSDTDQLSNP